MGAVSAPRRWSQHRQGARLRSAADYDTFTAYHWALCRANLRSAWALPAIALAFPQTQGAEATERPESTERSIRMAARQHLFFRTGCAEDDGSMKAAAGAKGHGDDAPRRWRHAVATEEMRGRLCIPASKAGVRSTLGQS